MNYQGKDYAVSLRDDGSLDTVITVNGKDYRFDQEYASEYRDTKTGELTESGFETLAKEAIEIYEEDLAMDEMGAGK